MDHLLHMSLASPQPESADRDMPVQTFNQPLRVSPKLSALTGPGLDFQKGLLGVHGAVLGGVPLEFYQEDHQVRVMDMMEEANRQPVFQVEMSAVDLNRELREALFSWYVAWLDSDTTEYDPVTYRNGWKPSLEARGERFAKDIPNALPFPRFINKDPSFLNQLGTRRLFSDSHPFFKPDGQRGIDWGVLFEKIIRCSYAISVDSSLSHLPFGSLRDFVLSILPSHLPIQRPSLHFKPDRNIGPHPINRLAKMDPDLVVRLVAHFGENFGRILALLSDFKPAKALENKGLTQVQAYLDWPDEIREVKDVRRSLDTVLPGVLSHLSKDPTIGQEFIEEVRSMPPFEREELNEWGKTNGFSDAELDALYLYILGKSPKDPAVLKAVMHRLVLHGAGLSDTQESAQLRPILIVEKDQEMDSETNALLSSLEDFERGPDQILIFKAKNRS